MNPNEIALNASELIVGNSYLAIFGEWLYDSGNPEIASKQNYTYEKNLKFIFLGMENDDCIYNNMSLTIIKVLVNGKIKFIFRENFGMFNSNDRFHNL